MHAFECALAIMIDSGAGGCAHTCSSVRPRKFSLELKCIEDSTVCLETLEVGEACVRVTCKHVFHREYQYQPSQSR